MESVTQGTPGSQWLDSVLSLPRTQVPPLVGQLRSHKSCGVGRGGGSVTQICLSQVK